MKSNPLIVLWFHCFSSARIGGRRERVSTEHCLDIWGHQFMVVHDRTGRGGGIWEAPCVLHTRVTVITDHSSPGHTDLPGNLRQSQDSESLTLSGVTVTMRDSGVMLVSYTILPYSGEGGGGPIQSRESQYNITSSRKKLSFRSFFIRTTKT